MAAAATGTIGPWTVAEANNGTFFVKNTIAANAFAGTPTLVFEQSDDNASWAPLPVVRADTNTVADNVIVQGEGYSTSLGAVLILVISWR